MSSPAPVPPLLPCNGDKPTQLASPVGQKSLQDRLHTWQQVVLAELLNLLERRRYDLS